MQHWHSIAVPSFSIFNVKMLIKFNMRCNTIFNSPQRQHDNNINVFKLHTAAGGSNEREKQQIEKKYHN